MTKIKRHIIKDAFISQLTKHGNKRYAEVIFDNLLSKIKIKNRKYYFTNSYLFYKNRKDLMRRSNFKYGMSIENYDVFFLDPINWLISILSYYRLPVYLRERFIGIAFINPKTKRKIRSRRIANKQFFVTFEQSIRFLVSVIIEEALSRSYRDKIWNKLFAELMMLSRSKGFAYNRLKRYKAQYVMHKHKFKKGKRIQAYVRVGSSIFDRDSDSYRYYYRHYINPNTNKLRFNKGLKRKTKRRTKSKEKQPPKNKIKFDRGFIKSGPTEVDLRKTFKFQNYKFKKLRGIDQFSVLKTIY